METALCVSALDLYSIVVIIREDADNLAMVTYLFTRRTVRVFANDTLTQRTVSLDIILHEQLNVILSCSGSSISKIMCLFRIADVISLLWTLHFTLDTLSVYYALPTLYLYIIRCKAHRVYKTFR